MNTMKILIGTTFAVLLACLFFSYNQMKTKLDENPETSERARLERRLAQLKAAAVGTYPSANAPTIPNNLQPNNTFQPTPNPLEAQALEMQKQKEIEDLRKQLAESESKTEPIEEAPEIPANETDAFAEQINEQPTPDSAKAARILQALLMARVQSWDPDAQLMAIRLDRPADVNTGSVLGIRRNSGIIGRIKVGTIEMSEAIADPIPGSFPGGTIDIRVGDELIVPPAY